MVNPGNCTSITTSGGKISKIITLGDAYFCSVEKYQFIKKRFNNNYEPAVQPSVHYGTYPVERLSTLNLLDYLKEFTDTRIH